MTHAGRIQPDLLASEERPEDGELEMPLEPMPRHRAECVAWICRTMLGFDAEIGRKTIALLGQALPRAPSHRPVCIYIAGVEGTGHHGVEPLIIFPMLARWGFENTAAAWRPLRAVFLRTPPQERREALRRLLAPEGCHAGPPAAILEFCSWPCCQGEVRKRLRAGCMDPMLLSKEVATGNPGGSFNLVEFVELMSEHAEVRVLGLHRDLVPAVWSHKDWDGGILPHARVLALFQSYLAEALGSLDPCVWRWLAYEDLCLAQSSGDWTVLDSLAKFFGLPLPELQCAFGAFSPSRRHAQREMPAQELAGVQELERRFSSDWLPGRFSEQHLLRATVSS